MSMAGKTAPPAAHLHRAIITLLAVSGGAAAILLGWHGAAYYGLPLTERPFHPQHVALRPAGYVGLRLGFSAALLFAGLYLYPLRKRIKPLQRIGKTRNWLDFHILLGLAVPVIVTYHSSLKLNGLAGMAYWIMIAIVLSGIVGRYLYSQIPRSVSAAEVSLRELQEEAERYAKELNAQEVYHQADLETLLRLPPAGEVAAMPIWRAIVTMALLDLRRPWNVAALRRRVLSSQDRWKTMGGFRRSSHTELERVVEAARWQSWLTSKILFLNRAAEVFHLWHVVHRPFSYSFAILVTAHVAMVMLMGYF